MINFLCYSFNMYLSTFAHPMLYLQPSNIGAQVNVNILQPDLDSCVIMVEIDMVRYKAHNYAGTLATLKQLPKKSSFV